MPGTKSYFLVSSCDIPPDGVLRLGAILTDPKEPYSVINEEHLIEPPDIITNEQSSFETSAIVSNLAKKRVWVAFLEFSGLASAIDESKFSHQAFRFDKLETRSFTPKIDYLHKSLQIPEIEAFVKGPRWRRNRLYVVTGLKVARGARFQQTNPSDTTAAAVANVALVQPPLRQELGGVGSSSFPHADTFQAATDFVFAYQLREIYFNLGRPRHVDSADPQPGASPIGEAEDRGTGGAGDEEPSDRETLVPKDVKDEPFLAPDVTRPLRILCLDGGGVRGISSLCILKELMLQVGREKLRREQGTSAGENRHGNVGSNEARSYDQIPKPECVKPCNYFDLICGTSTGGLIALMLGRLRYVSWISFSIGALLTTSESVDEAIDHYTKLTKTVFTASKWYSFASTAKYKASVLEDCLRLVIENAPAELNSAVDLKSEAMMEDLEGCPTFVVATSLLGNGTTPFLLRTYKSSAEPPGPFLGKIWQVGRATSAAPTFFDPITIESTTFLEAPTGNGEENQGKGPGLSAGVPTKKHKFADGGTTANNPTLQALIEAERLWQHRKIGAVISLGTGVAPDVRLGEEKHLMSWWSWGFHKILPMLGHMADVADYCVKCATDCEAVHDLACAHLTTRGWRERYFRLNVPHTVGGFVLDEWEKVPVIQDLTEKYMRDDKYANDSKEKIGLILFDPELEQIKDQNMHWGHTSILPLTEPKFNTTIKIPETAYPNNGKAPTILTSVGRESLTDQSSQTEPPITWTWTSPNNQFPTLQSLVFENDSPKTQDFWNLDGRDGKAKNPVALESAICVLELTSTASFVSTKFVNKWKLKTYPLTDPLKGVKLTINGTRVESESLVWLTFRCPGFGMETQRQWFRVLKSEDFEILFGSEIAKKETLGGGFVRNVSHKPYIGGSML
jgi:patatin-like phospholipase/acyl hydrolase